LPKATWGGDLTAADIDGAERNTGFTPYAGPLPPAGVYRFAIKQMKKGESGSGNPKLLTIAELDGSWKPEHKKYDGAPLFDHMPVMKQTAFRIAALTDALGISASEFLSKMVVDEDGKVTKLGSLGDPNGLLIYINVKRRPAENGYAEQLQLSGTGYIPAPESGDEGDEDQTDGDEGDEGDEEPPF
jgi:hypothetical protein